MCDAIQGKYIIDTINATRYHKAMIRSFASKETERLFERKFSKRLPQDIQRRARVKLEILDPPSNRLEKFYGNRKDQHSIRINIQWRICFKWHNGNAYHVEIVDYH